MHRHRSLLRSRPLVALGAALLIASPLTADPNTRDAKGAAETGLPKVLLIGDSISIGYTEPVTKLLQGKADVRRIPGNGEHTGTGLRKLDEWLGSGKWDVVHFNWGLWDLCYRHPESKLQGNRDKLNGTLTTTLDVYEDNLDKLVHRLKKTGAKLIWAHTTMVPEGEPGRKVGDDARYNEAAARVMRKHGVPVNDLHALTRTFEPGMFTQPGDVHYTATGSERIATQVARAIESALAGAPHPATPAAAASPDLQGDPRAQLALAIRHRDGDGVPRDLGAAMRWAHLAADAGHEDAQDFVGWMFFTGKGVKRNPTLAAAYFSSAADRCAAAAWNLGQCYFAAQGVSHDVPRALDLWNKAATMGHGRAASTAAMTYLSGEGITPDPAQARRLAALAAELDDPNGLIVLGELHFQAGELEQARTAWTKVSQIKPVGPTGNPDQPSAEVAAQQGADLLKLMDLRRRRPEPGKLALVPVPHLHQGWNNCGATSCAMFARALGAKVGGWDFKKLCPSPLGTGTDWDHLVMAAAKIGHHWKLVTFPADDDGFATATAFARAELDAGRPLVIDFKYIGDRYPGGAAGHTLLLAGYIADENLYVLCNPAIATPGLHLISAPDLDKYWRSDGYSSSSGGVLSRPAIALDPQTTTPSPP